MEHNTKTSKTQEVDNKVNFLLNFFSRFDVVAYRQSSGAPSPGHYDGGVESLIEILKAHVAGKQLPIKAALSHNGTVTTLPDRIGTYTPNQDNKTAWACIDFDGKKQTDKTGHAVNLADPLDAIKKSIKRADEAGLHYHVELTSSGAGYHLWILFSEPIEAAIAKKLGLLLTPTDCDIEGGGKAVPGVAPLEVFPKQEKHGGSKHSYGNLVWLPLWHEAITGRCELYNIDSNTHYDWTTPNQALANTPESVTTAIQVLEGIGYTVPQQPRKQSASSSQSSQSSANGNYQHRPISAPQTDGSWRAWRKAVLEAFTIEDIYREHLTSITRSDGSIELHDNFSLAGTDGKTKPSRLLNVTSNGKYERGSWHSWRTGEHGSVFDYMVESGQAPDIHKAMKILGEKTGIPTPSDALSMHQLRQWEEKLLEECLDVRNREMFPVQEAEYIAKLEETIKDTEKLKAATVSAHRPHIDARNGDLADMEKKAKMILKAARTVDGHPLLYRYSGSIVQVSRDENGIAKIEGISLANMVSLLAQEAYWYDTDKTNERKPAHPPRIVAEGLVADKSPDLPIIQRVTQAPIFSHDGKVSTKPGYQHDSRTYYVKRRGQEIPEIPLNPTDADIAAAKGWIDELLWDFPFEKDGKTPGTSSSRANAIALLLLGFVREMIPGPTPFHLVDAPMMGTGKGLLAECLMHAFLGHPLISVQWPKNQEEQGKQITSTLLTGQSVFYLDNLEGAFGGPYICSVTTQPMWAARILGVSKDANLPVRQVFIGSGNNVQVQKDMVRRVVPIRLNAQTVDAAARTGWRHPQPRWAFENRSMLVHSALVLIQAWISNGMRKGIVVYGSYDDYASVMSGILENAGISGFLENLKTVADNDQQEAGLVAFLSDWWESLHIPGGLVTSECGVKELAILAARADLSLGKSSDDSGYRHRLGQLLTKNKDRVFKLFDSTLDTEIGVRLVLGRTKKRVSQYRLERVS